MMKAGLVILLVLLAVSGWSHQVYNQRQQLNNQAHLGNAEAQYQLANIYWQNESRTAAYYWWRRSAEQHYSPAIKSLVKAFPKANKTWLQLAAAAGDPSAKQQVAADELADKSISINQWQRRWEGADGPWFEHQVGLLEHYQQTRQCDMTINVIAESAGEKGRYLNFLSAVKNSPFNSENWCVSYTSESTLSCVTYTVRNRANCQLGTGFDKQVVLADKGIASADNQTLTLTSDSSEEVIQHELGHWMGLADEYEMSEPLARKFCHGHYSHDSLNIIVTEAKNYYSAKQVRAIYQRLPWKSEISSWQDIATLEQGRWRLGSSETDEIGLFKADTCNAINGRQAWRPVNIRTAMEQHDTKRWPDLYLRLISQKN